MPRLLPRLVEEVQRVRAKYDSKVFDTRSNFSPKVKHATSSRLAAVPQTFSFRGRRQSLLLDKVNPILHRESFSHKKSKKPSVRKVTNEGNDENSMSFAERGFSSNPYRGSSYRYSHNCVLRCHTFQSYNAIVANSSVHVDR